MKIRILAIGDRPPTWVRDGWAEYARRLPHPYAPALIELPAGVRGKGRDPVRAVAEEGERMLAALPKGAIAVALDERGQAWTTTELARRLDDWSREGRDLALLIGGPDGHAPAVRERAELAWSLSPLTLPHMLVRLLLIEQLYRAWTLNAGHPYHRA